ncbi:4-carboxy-4-hydroxy-2-oxoadipate aldolase (plasmid) [Pseudarthrobacter phenanthrenivorans Sphe3]|uniref:Putative 4-hydroxy-4-methyl-2-oxoglutarate aldolase n=1 Tax=Pseudarthrobacter phenanthrenivorans (strain DSM 18606 / JCM 16027 / LMG 23796 / Sphe3) TaxID=930171 RepID=F0MCP5_PSEPM|nr:MULTISPECIES: 4-carboxy-4-hydroxy-2-oxoadipate aldolase/oxaloacetate decarboxylase [Micrococcaceae]ABK05812.1 4-carboxy-4-hydroxy-2-oxoadipate aldolase [Arthrobacter sp. FB24]ADX75301.1 4-carboxy-4-hydroxy-2-oxoadipate aldolase [Pseudarthrobacter phenanthrenivorans Sphe3]
MRLNNLGIVRTNIERPDPTDVKRLSQFGVSTIHEAMGRVGLLRPYIRPAYTGAKLCGPAVTVLLQPGDNWMFHVAVEQVQEGDVIVAGCTTESEDGFFGELLATSLTARGCKGLVIDGGVRDVADLEKMDFPVFSRAVNAKGTVKATLGSVNIPVVVANAVVNSGDVVVADVDGVVVVPRELVRAVADASQKREDNEEAKRMKFREGALGLDVYGMRGPLAKAGLEYVEN